MSNFCICRNDTVPKNWDWIHLPDMVKIISKDTNHLVTHSLKNCEQCNFYTKSYDTVFNDITIISIHKTSRWIVRWWTGVQAVST